MKITASERFKQELDIFNEKLDTISDEKLKDQVLDLIEKLKIIMGDIDIGHDGNLNGFMNPHLISHKRHEIISIREKIYKLLGLKLKERQTT